MNANPILAESTRNGTVENLHRGAWCVVDSDGTVIASEGDVVRPVFPRSAIKPFQAMALFHTGAVAQFGLEAEEIALACASHSAEDPHVQGVRRFLDKSDSSVDDFACGVHPPVDAAARKALRKRGEQPTALHNNCSGKHAGMLANAAALGAPAAGYAGSDHEVQRAVRAAIEAAIGEPLDEDRCGVDGCSLPAWTMSLIALGRGFARMATGRHLSESDASAARQIFGAMTAHPFLVGGSDRFDTIVMEAFGGRLTTKGGADGVHAGAVEDLGLGFAVKIDDGSNEAADTATAALIERCAKPDEKERTVLAGLMAKPRLNVRGIQIGEIVAVR